MVYKELCVYANFVDDLKFYSLYSQSVLNFAKKNIMFIILKILNVQ